VLHPKEKQIEIAALSNMTSVLRLKIRCFTLAR